MDFLWFVFLLKISRRTYREGGKGEVKVNGRKRKKTVRKLEWVQSVKESNGVIVSTLELSLPSSA